MINSCVQTVTKARGEMETKECQVRKGGGVKYKARRMEGYKGKGKEEGLKGKQGINIQRVRDEQKNVGGNVLEIVGERWRGNEKGLLRGLLEAEASCSATSAYSAIKGDHGWSDRNILPLCHFSAVTSCSLSPTIDGYIFRCCFTE